MVHERQSFKYLYFLNERMGTVKVKDHDGKEREFTKLSSNDEALTLAIQELTKSINLMRTQRNG